MLYDDIYYAAIAGDTATLRKLLSTGAGKLALNEKVPVTYDDTDDGLESGELPVIFSIIAEMVGNVNYEVLDILLEHGADLNAMIALKGKHISKDRPLLEFAVSVWRDAELTEYLLEKGANPDSTMVYRYADGNISKTTVLYYAIAEFDDTEMMEILLKYGANPDKCCVIYNEELQVYQHLPPLYYSLVYAEDYDKTVCLFSYNASPQCGIDVGKGIKHNTNFTNYIRINYPHLSEDLMEAFEEGREDPGERVRDVVTNRPMTAQEYQDDVDSGTLGHTLKSGSNVTSFAPCYGKFAAFITGNFGLLALSLCVIAPLVFLYKSESDVAGMMFLLGLPIALIVGLITLSVYRKAKKRGQDGVLGRFFLDSFFMFVKTLLVMSLILIPLVGLINTNFDWEEKTTSDGRHVTVRKNGDGTYVDANGNNYYTKD